MSIPSYMTSSFVSNDYYKNGMDKLVDSLLMIPEFHNKNSLIPFYVAYDFPHKQKHLNIFWFNCIHHVLKNYFSKIVFNKQEVKTIFTFGKFRPLCLDDIIVYHISFFLYS